MVNTRQWILATKPKGMPQLSGPEQTFKLVEKDIGEPQDGQVLVKVLYFSNDPAQRGWISPGANPKRLYVPPVAEGAVMNSYAIAEVVESKVPNFKKGDHVTGPTGWSEYAVLPAQMCNPAPSLPNGLSETHYLGALGMTGLTGYYGIKEVARTTADDVVVVSGAAGATGSMVVQIAKNIIGSKKVIGIAGSDDKCRWVESLGADICLNYKSSSFKQDLRNATPDYADVYFDNVGGEILDLMLTRMARHGRIAACGAISDYNTAHDQISGVKNWFEIISMRIEIKGFIVIDYLHKAAETLEIFKKALQEGKVKISEKNEHIVPAKFDQVPETWMTLFEGSNTGKLITALQ